MTIGAIVFMLLSWAGVLGLVGWAYYRILTHREHFDPDGTGPASPPEGALFDPEAGGR